MSILHTLSLHGINSGIILVIAFSLQGCGLIYIEGITPGFSKDDLADRDNFNWVTGTTAHFDIYYEPGSWSEKHLSFVEADAESSLVRVLRLLHEPSYDDRIYYFIVNNRSRMKALIGQQTNGRAFPKTQIVCAIANDSVRALGPHEIFHVIGVNLWGSTENWVNEGMAVYSDNDWWRQDLHPLSQYLKIHSRLVPVKDLIEHFRSYNDIITYPQSGSYLKFIYERYGIEKVKILWKKGWQPFLDSIGTTSAELEQNWLHVLSTCSVDSVRYPLPD